ncbi:uncharacterized protein LOC118095314 [Zootoca vivipara]|uniref:uncharacterized protein LOC118095314 n=1 Tax=Zootoca vivipara TaxID=8524 RepID=UPI00293BC86A|nr:uncharacterized protein LOC118095314 [Zootoca vivipara]
MLGSMSSCCTVCVRGYPADLPPERVSDKLMIHFLRARNGGGEIASIEFPPESPGCAMVTFEDATVTQQVLKAKKHVLTVNGNDYPLEVTASATELDPNEIFVRVCMKVDYGRFPDGKETLDSLCQRYGGIHTNFNAQEMTCTVKGSFVELQAFSCELLRCLNSKQRAGVPFANGGRSAEKAAGDGISHQEATREEKKGRKKRDKEEKAAAGPLQVRESAESLIEPLEDFSLVIDSDIYLYMQKFCSEELSNIFHKQQVGLVDVHSDGITTLYLRAASNGAGGVSALVSAHLALSQLSQQLEGTLRKEKVKKRDLGVIGGRSFPAELQSLFPLLLIQEEEEDFCLIGNLVEVSRAKQHIQELIAARGAAQDHRRPGVPQAAYLHGQSSVPALLESPAGSVPRKLSSPKPNSKAERKLAASFSSLGSPPAPKRHALESERSLSFLATGTEPKSQIRQTLEFRKALQGMKADPPPSAPAGTVSSSEGRASLSLAEPLSLSAVTSAFRSLNLFDTTGAADFRVSAPRPRLRRSSSLSLQKPLSGNESVPEPWLAAQVSAAHLKQESQEYTHRTLQKEIRKDGLTQIEDSQEMESPVTKQRHSLHTVQSDNGSPSGTQKAEALAEYLGYIYESFTYTELAMDGPEDESLDELCRYLKNFDDRIVISRERYKLGLAYPREEKLQVLEVFRLFSARRMAALSKQTPFRDAQQGGIQGEASAAGSAQQLNESRRNSLLESSLGLDSLAGETSPSQAQRRLQDSGFQPVQNFPSHQIAWQSGALDQTPDASKQGRSRRLLAESRQGLPDKFHFARDCNKEGSSQERERALLGSLPDLPLRASPPAGEGLASDLGLGTASLGSESVAEECVMCQNSRPALTHAPCPHKPCRVQTPGGSPLLTHPGASPGIPGTFGASTISQSLPGYIRDPTLKITYNIPDGVQQAGDPFPGHLYRGGRFEAFLPDNPEGRRLMVLLHKAFERSLTFRIRTCGLEERVTWGPIPHKTSMEGGKARNGYPDSQYLQQVSLKLKELNIE